MGATDISQHAPNPRYVKLDSCIEAVVRIERREAVVASHFPVHRNATELTRSTGMTKE